LHGTALQPKDRQETVGIRAVRPIFCSRSIHQAVKNMVHVVRNPHGWWDVRTDSGEVIVRFVSEFQACEAGRMEAARLRADLAIHQPDGATRYEFRDRGAGRLESAAADAGQPIQATRPDGMRPRRLILLVEDRVDSRELYAEYLTYAGFSVVTAINGHEALRLARHLLPDLILMDLMMPGMGGIEATIDLKADPNLAHIPVVAVTADHSAEAAADALAAGCVMLVTKPVLPDEVARRINAVLSSIQPGVSARAMVKPAPGG
jgi:CheY-like chemotaxis protein